MIEFWRSQLSDHSKKQYDVLLKASRNQKRSVELTKTPDMVNEINRIISGIRYDHPELYSLSPRVALAMSSYSLRVDLSYLYDARQRRDIDRSFAHLQQELDKERNKTDMEKVYAAAFLIAKNSRYEINHIGNQNAASAIHFHAAQCSGFSAAFKYAMDWMGIWCIVVSGNVEGEPHAWNVVKLDEAYYHIDITSLTSITLTDSNQLSALSLLASDEQKKQRGYVWDFAKIPACIEMRTSSSEQSNGSGRVTPPIGQTNATMDHGNLPTMTRLFDVQAKIRECLQNRTTVYEFLLNIPMYSNEKLVNMVSNYISEQIDELAISLKAEVRFENGRYCLKFNYMN